MPQILTPDGRILHFSPTHWHSSPTLQSRIQTHLDANEIQAALTLAFELSPNDKFQYWAHMPITLPEMQRIVNLGDVRGLQHWYAADQTSPSSKSEDSEQSGSGNGGQGTSGSGSSYEKPSHADITAYTLIFSPMSSPLSALNALHAGAKPHSIRQRVATHLLSKRYLHPSLPAVPRLNPKANLKPNISSTTSPQSQAQPHWNPALPFFTWYCHTTHWCGPVPLPQLRNINHPALPIMMHHFGCVIPSYEALELLRLLTITTNTTSDSSSPRTIHEIGSGNGYWTYLLRRHGLNVCAVDNAQSIFRTNWIGDTINMDALEYLESCGGAVDGVLLMVYPVVSGEFTRQVLDAFKGDTVVIAGTQNGNGYTGFKDVVIDEWMERERQGWVRVARVPLPSFPGKDEAMFVFCRTIPEWSGSQSRGGVEGGETQASGRNAKANARKKAKKKAKAGLTAAQVEQVEVEAHDDS